MQKTIPERLVILFFEFDHSNRPKSGLKNGSDNYQKIKILLLHRSSGLRVWKLSQMEKSNSTMTVITFTNIFGDHWPPNAVSGSDNFKILLFRLYWKNRYFPIHKWTKNARFRKRNIISATYRNYSFIGVFCTFLSRKCRPNRFLVFLKKNWKNPIHNLSTQSTQIEKNIWKAMPGSFCDKSHWEMLISDALRDFGFFSFRKFSDPKMAWPGKKWSSYCKNNVSGELFFLIVQERDIIRMT